MMDIWTSLESTLWAGFLWTGQLANIPSSDELLSTPLGPLTTIFSSFRAIDNKHWNDWFFT